MDILEARQRKNQDPDHGKSYLQRIAAYYKEEIENPLLKPLLDEMPRRIEDYLTGNLKQRVLRMRTILFDDVWAVIDTSGNVKKGDLASIIYAYCVDWRAPIEMQVEEFLQAYSFEYDGIEIGGVGFFNAWNGEPLLVVFDPTLSKTTNGITAGQSPVIGLIELKKRTKALLESDQFLAAIAPL